MSTPEPVFVNLLSSPGINSQPGVPVRQPYLTYRAARLHIGWRNRFLGSLNVYKLGLWMLCVWYSNDIKIWKLKVTWSYFAGNYGLHCQDFASQLHSSWFIMRFLFTPKNKFTFSFSYIDFTVSFLCPRTTLVYDLYLPTSITITIQFWICTIEIQMWISYICVSLQVCITYYVLQLSTIEMSWQRSAHLNTKVKELMCLVQTPELRTHPKRSKFLVFIFISGSLYNSAH